MSFASVFHQVPWKDRYEQCLSTTPEQVEEALEGSGHPLARFERLISPAAGDYLEALCQHSQSITQQRFGKVIRLFAPLYLSNECINNCSYCGFSRDNPILRVTLKTEEVLQEANALAEQGFRHILLVAGEHPKFVSNGYLEDCIHRLAHFIPSLSLEVGPMEQEDYVPLVRSGAEGLVVYQETYDREIYRTMHTSGPKKKFDWRLDTPERAFDAGFRRLGIGALFGLADWRTEAIALAAHVEHLLRRCWTAQVTLSFPRLRPCAGSFEPLTLFDDRSLVQCIAAFRLCFPDVGQVLSTREPASLRDGLISLGITTMSAGSHTEPGGYTGAGQDNLHQTVRGRIQNENLPFEGTHQEKRKATGQFDIADDRSPSEMADVILKRGYEPVWKDWDASILSPS